MPSKATCALLTNLSRIVLFAAVLAVTTSANAASFLYTDGNFTPINVPDTIDPIIAGINDAGQIVGDNFSTAFLYTTTNGNFTQISVPGSVSTEVGGINNAGQIAGTVANATSENGVAYSVFLYSGGNFTQISVPGLEFVTGINDAGQIIGQIYNATGIHSFLDSGGNITEIAVPGASITDVEGINDLGQIVGQFLNNTGIHGFLDSNGSFTQIDVPGATSTAAFGINNAGQIVGSFSSNRGLTPGHGFLDTNGNFTQIDAPGATTTVYGINDAGQMVVVGNGSATGDPHFTTYDGIHYDYQGLGDFLLTRSTAPGDQFEVEIRTRPMFGNAAATIISDAAATVCNHDVTFDIDRASIGGGSFVWLDGSPTTLTLDNPILTLGVCRIVELSINSYEVDWNTGEILDVTDNGTYLDLFSSLSWIDGLGSVEGLLSTDINPDAWRVTDGPSLLDPIPEPTTLSLISIGIGFAAMVMMRRASSARATASTV
jgi:von Willebrand factor type D domain